MPDFFHDFRQGLRERLLRLLWRQWTALGVAGSDTGAADSVIDPEALLLASTQVARHDPRLFDELLDWLTTNGDRINLQRLKRLHEIHRLGDITVLRAIATRQMRSAALRKWALLARGDSPQKPAAAPQVLFLKANSAEPMAFFGAKDPDFLAHGWLRPPVETRGLSAAPSPHAAPAFLLKLRALFGVQARAELLAALLTRESATPAELATLTGYTARTAETTLRDLSASGLVYRHRHGREMRCRVRPEEWSALLPRGSATFPTWSDWPPRYAALISILRVTDSHADADSLLISSELRVVCREYGAALAAFGVQAGDADTGVSFAQVLRADLFRRLDAPGAPV